MVWRCAMTTLIDLLTITFLALGIGLLADMWRTERTQRAAREEDRAAKAVAAYGERTPPRTILIHYSVGRPVYEDAT